LNYIKFGKKSYRYMIEDVEKWLGVKLKVMPPPPPPSPRVAKLINDFVDGKTLAAGAD
jgi:hypothetical protein